MVSPSWSSDYVVMQHDALGTEASSVLPSTVPSMNGRNSLRYHESRHSYPSKQCHTKRGPASPLSTGESSECLPKILWQLVLGRCGFTRKWITAGKFFFCGALCAFINVSPKRPAFPSYRNRGDHPWVVLSPRITVGLAQARRKNGSNKRSVAWSMRKPLNRGL